MVFLSKSKGAPKRIDAKLLKDFRESIYFELSPSANMLLCVGLR